MIEELKETELQHARLMVGMAGSKCRRGERKRGGGGMQVVLTHEGQLPGPLLGRDDLQRRGYGLNANDWLVGVIRSWHS